MTASTPGDGELSAGSADDTSKIAKGGAIQIGGQIAARGLLFLFVAVAVRRLGEAGFGVYRQVFQILQVASLMAPMGFNFAAVRFITRARALGRHGEVRGTARVTLWGAAIFSSLAAGAIFLAASPLAGQFADSPASRADLADLLRLGSLYVPLFAVMQVLRSCTQAYKTMVPSAMIGQIILPVGRLILGIGALLAGFAVAGAVASLVISAAISMVAGFWYFHRMLTPTERRAKPAAPVGEIVRFALPQAGVALFSVQSLGISVLLLGLLSSDHAVGIFSVALSLQGIGAVFLTGVVAIWAPLVVDLYERNEIARLESLYQTVNRWVATFAFPVFAVLILAPEIPLRLLTGGVDPETARLIGVLAVGNLFFVGSGPCSYLISMTGRAGLNLANSVVSVVLYVALGLWIVPRYGAVGMAVVDAAVTALLNIARLVQAKVLIGVQPFGRSYAKPVLGTLALVVTLLLWRALTPPEVAFELAGLVAGALAYLAILRLAGMDPEERHVYDLIRSKMLRRKRR
ncbi:MAG: oligosaccharide flippase family protein [Actinomycetota bacterium]